MKQAMDNEQGFSLIEALVAMLILALASIGLIRASEAHIDSIRGLERRAAADLVAQNRLAELRLHISPLPNETDMLGERWAIAVSEKATDDPELRAITIAVRPADEQASLARLEGFVEAGSGQ